MTHFLPLTVQNLHVLDPNEQTALVVSLDAMQHDVQQTIEDAAAADRLGTVHPVTLVSQGPGQPGAPRKVIDCAWLTWAYSRRNTSDIARFLNVSRDLVRRTLIDYHLAERGEDPFIRTSDPLNPYTTHYQQIYSTSVAVSSWTDAELDAAVTRLRILFPKAGIAMLKGSLQSLGHNVPREWIRLSLLRLDPLNRLFQRPYIERRKYWVPGPNYLWHHDGQHGMISVLSLNSKYIDLIFVALIRWGIVTHGFIDGYSRVIVGMQASNNNRAATVFGVFHRSASQWGIPSRLRGDHGTENVEVAAYMVHFRGAGRGSYMWGRWVSSC